MHLTLHRANRNKFRHALLSLHQESLTKHCAIIYPSYGQCWFQSHIELKALPIFFFFSTFFFDFCKAKLPWPKAMLDYVKVRFVVENATVLVFFDVPQPLTDEIMLSWHCSRCEVRAVGRCPKTMQLRQRFLWAPRYWSEGKKQPVADNFHSLIIIML